jgi:hypothetical protein
VKKGIIQEEYSFEPDIQKAFVDGTPFLFFITVGMCAGVGATCWVALFLYLKKSYNPIHPVTLSHPDE